MKALLPAAIAFAFALTGCATRAVQTEELLSRDRVAFRHLEDVPFVEQSAGHCGPATLTMAMRAAGAEVSLEEITPTVYTPGMKGTFQTDMVVAARRRGFAAVPIAGLEALKREIDAGRPVIVFMNLALTWAPNWHYAVVTGYDLPRGEIIMHSGPDRDRHWDLRKFERSWMLGDYWGLVVLPPSSLSAGAGELAHVAAGAGLEQAGRLKEAGIFYGKILERWPDSLGALVGSANVAYAEKRFADSVRFLRRAARKHPDSEVVRHNLAVASAEWRRAAGPGSAKNGPPASAALRPPN